MLVIHLKLSHTIGDTLLIIVVRSTLAILLEFERLTTSVAAEFWKPCGLPIPGPTMLI